MKSFITLALLLFSTTALSAESHQYGKIFDITSIQEGLLVRIDTGKPSGCTQNSEWMLIPEGNSTMVSTALAMHMAGKSNATVYVDITASGSYCKIVQYDPQP